MLAFVTYLFKVRIDILHIPTNRVLHAYIPRFVVDQMWYILDWFLAVGVSVVGASGGDASEGGSVDVCVVTAAGPRGGPGGGKRGAEGGSPSAGEETPRVARQGRQGQHPQNNDNHSIIKNTKMWRCLWACSKWSPWHDALGHGTAHAQHTVLLASAQSTVWRALYVTTLILAAVTLNRGIAFCSMDE